MTKPRKHRWVTEALKANVNVLSVWPSEGEVKSKSGQKKFMGVIEKVGNDPRVTKVEKKQHEEHGEVFLFHLED